MFDFEYVFKKNGYNYILKVYGWLGSIISGYAECDMVSLYCKGFLGKISSLKISDSTVKTKMT